MRYQRLKLNFGENIKIIIVFSIFSKMQFSSVQLETVFAYDHGPAPTSKILVKMTTFSKTIMISKCYSVSKQQLTINNATAT